MSASLYSGSSATRSRDTAQRRSASSRSRVSQVSSYVNSNTFIVALCTGRGLSHEIGLAAVNLVTSQCHIYQFVDLQTFSKTLHKLHILSPLEIIMPTTFSYPRKTKLFGLIEENFPSAKLIPFPRQSFNDIFGSSLIEQLSVPQEFQSLKHILSSKIYALSAVAALIKYVETVGKIVFSKQSMFFNYNALEGTMLIDTTTVRTLELVRNANDVNSNLNLFGAINHTFTPMGARFLRTNILQPLCDTSTIEMRLNAVEELAGNEYVYMSLRDSLTGLIDIDRVISSLVQLPAKSSIKAAEQLVNNVICVKFILKRLPLILEPLSYINNDLIKAISFIIANEDLNAVIGIIDETLNEDITYQKTALGLKNQRCYAVKANHSELLDVARQTYKETTNDAYELATSYAEKYNLPIKISYNANRGFHLLLHQDQISNDFPQEFINIVQRGQSIVFTTLQMMSINSRIQESLVEIILMSNKIISELTERIRSYIFSFYKLSEAIALLDMMMSFARFKNEQDVCCRPEFVSNGLTIKGGVHPIKKIATPTAFVPYDYFISAQNNIQFLTGPNMSGKSTYLKECALLVVMAHIGSYIPAKYAKMKVFKSLFAQVGNDNSGEANASTFTQEMQQTSVVLSNITEDSLLILDEIGRGSSTNDGQAIAIGICEKLAASTAFSLVATHFHSAVTDMEMYPNVLGLSIGVKDNNQSVFSVEPGVCKNTNYGIELASRSGFPSEAIEFATQMKIELRKDVYNLRRLSPVNSPDDEDSSREHLSTETEFETHIHETQAFLNAARRVGTTFDHVVPSANLL